MMPEVQTEMPFRAEPLQQSSAVSPLGSMLLLFGGLVAAATAAGLRFGWIVIGLPNFQALSIAQAMVVGATLAYLVDKLRIHSRRVALGIAALCAARYFGYPSWASRSPALRFI